MPTIPLTHIQHTQLDPTTWCMTARVSAPSFAIDFSIDSRDIWHPLSWAGFSDTVSIDTIRLDNIDWHFHRQQTPPSARRIAHAQRQHQRQGVRKLLQVLLDNLEIDDTLDDSSFPYRLTDSKYYVCFSHTAGGHKGNTDESLDKKIGKISYNQVAVVISHHRPAGIDIETSNVAWQVVTRFYSDNEIALLQAMPTSQRDMTAKFLWQIKESFIKINQHTLAQGLGKDYAYLIPSLSSTHLPEIDVSRSDNNHHAIERIHTIDSIEHKSPYRICVLPSQQTVVIF